MEGGVLLIVSAMELISATDFLALRVALRVALVAAEARAERAEIAAAEAANIKAINADLLARNALLELQIEKLKRGRFGPTSERSARLIDQMELVFEELEANANEASASGEGHLALVHLS